MPTTPDWARIKRQVIRERGYQCEVCGYSLVVECDHVKPKAYGGLDEIENAVLLCPNCHHLKNRVFRQTRYKDKYGMPKNRQECITGIREYIKSATDNDLYRLDNPAEDLIVYENAAEGSASDPMAALERGSGDAE